MGVITPFHYLTFDGKSSADFGVWISGGGTYNAPVRDVDAVSVPGRNGELYFDNGRFANIEVTYPAFISRDFQSRIDAFRAWVCSHVGYKRLEDTYHLDEFRLATYKSGLDVATTPRNLGGRFDLIFDCKPQRFLKSGMTPVEFRKNGVLHNNHLYDALPLIRCYGESGKIIINEVAVSATGLSSFVDLDCDAMEASEGENSRNNNIVLADGAFPVLKPGDNTITFTGFSRIEILPRWWTI